MDKYDPYADERVDIPDEYEYYEGLFDPSRTDRRGWRKRRPVPRHIPKRSKAEIIDGLADSVGLAGGFKTTYKPGRHE